MDDFQTHQSGWLVGWLAGRPSQPQPPRPQVMAGPGHHTPYSFTRQGIESGLIFLRIYALIYFNPTII